MAFAFEVVKTVRREEPDLFDADLEEIKFVKMLDEAIECEFQFAKDVLAGGIVGLSLDDMRQYLRYRGSALDDLGNASALQLVKSILLYGAARCSRACHSSSDVFLPIRWVFLEMLSWMQRSEQK